MTMKTIDILNALRKKIDNTFGLATYELYELSFTILAKPNVDGTRSLTFGVIAYSDKFAIMNAQVLLDQWCARNKRDAKDFTLHIIGVEPPPPSYRPSE